ncbi:MAG: efflux RND transporter periplasmic adaptor subunit [Pirellulaceae bacterium]
MSTAGPVDPPSQAATSSFVGGGFAPPGAAAPPPESVDPQLIQQTKNEIRVLIQEIHQLSRATIPVEQFYEEFLRRVVSALAAQGGSIWTRTDNGELEAQYQINLPADSLDENEGRQGRHLALLKNVLASGQATLVPPKSGSPDNEDAGNPSDYLLVLATLEVDQQIVGVIEIFQRPGGGPTTQRGYLRFLVQMSALAGEFLKNRRLRHLGDRQALWENLERFIREVHRRLDSQSTAYSVVNESRRLIQCDRVSLTLANGRRHRVAAISGLDTIDRRAEEVQLLGRLATVVAAAGQPLLYAGRAEDIPPQIERHLDAYLDRSHATLLYIVPLHLPEDEEVSPRRDSRRTRPIAALVVEQLSDHRMQEGMIERAETVAVHSASALANAMEHESLFLLPLWRALGKARWIVQARTLPKTLFVAAALVAVAMAMWIVPADFDLAAQGKLQPSVRRDMFAHMDGVVIEVPVKHEQLVEPGQILARLSNNRLDVEISNLIGRQRTTRERILSIQRAQLDGRQLGFEEQNRLAGELLELRQVAENLDRELALLRRKEERLIVRSEMRGQVVTWDIGGTLLGRPVQTGQLLMTIVDLRGDWELELRVPERRVGHVSQAAAESREGLKVTFMLASHPDRQFTGRVVEIHRSAEVQAEQGNTVLMKVAFDKDQLPELRSEISVTASIDCGRRPIGYVLFHELMETVQSKVLFWL